MPSKPQLFQHTSFLASLTLIILCPVSVFGQNLVPDPSFEDTISCPTFNPTSEEFNQSMTHWFNPTFGTADLYHTCAGQNGVPVNVYGFNEFPRTGNGYAGMAVSGAGWDAREYVSSELSERLQKGIVYAVEFYVKYPCNSGALI